MRRTASALLATALVAAALIGIVGSGSPAAAEPLPNAPQRVVQDAAFTLGSSAGLVSDATASDHSAAAMPGSGSEWGIQFRDWDFSDLRAGTMYDAIVRVKVTYAGAASGDALKLGVYDMTDGSDLIPGHAVSSSRLPDGQWVDVNIGRLSPTASVDVLSFYVAQNDNAAVQQIRVDKLTLAPASPLVVEDSAFTLGPDAARAAEPTAMDDSAAVMTNGPGGTDEIQVPVPATQMQPGVPYTATAYVRLERTDMLTSTGVAFTVRVTDVTAGVDLIAPHPIQTGDEIFEYAYNFVWPVALGQAVFDASHDNRIIFQRSDNAAVFPAVDVDKAVFDRASGDAITPTVSAHPQRITPDTSPGVNDTTTVSYDAGTGQTVSAVVKSSAGTAVRTLLNATAQSGPQSLVWDGKDGNGTFAPADLYTVELTIGSSVRRVAVLVHPGLTLSTPTVAGVRDFVPRGVWYLSEEIPNNLPDATSYLEKTFGDLQEMGANTVVLSTYQMEVRSAAITQEVFDQAQAHGLKIILNVRHFLTVYGSEVQGDEFALKTRIDSWISQIKTHPALLGYLLYDEPPTATPIIDNLKNMQAIWQDADPDHAVFVDLNGVEAPNTYHDALKPPIMASDPYPMQVNHAPGDFTRLMGYADVDYENWLDYLSTKPRRDATDDAPFWTVLQLFGDPLTSIREPSPAEVDATTVEAIGRGSKAAIYFMYQSTIRWEGLVDPGYHRTSRWTTAKNEFAKIAALDSTIRSMRRIGDVATAQGGGGGHGAYAAADVTSHRDTANGDLILTVVNHDVENTSAVTVTVDPARWPGAITGVTDAATGSAVSWSGQDITMSMAPGEGRVLRVKTSSTPGTVVIENSAFTVASPATKATKDVEAIDGSAATSPMSPTQAWNFQVALNPAQYAAGKSYEVWAWVKARYTTDLLSNPRAFPSYTDTALTVGIYDGASAHTIAGPTAVTGAQLADSRYTLVKLGVVTPHDWGAPYLYVAPSASANYDLVSVDQIVLRPN